jgi:hypothetical protein
MKTIEESYLLVAAAPKQFVTIITMGEDSFIASFEDATCARASGGKTRAEAVARLFNEELPTKES